MKTAGGLTKHYGKAIGYKLNGALVSPLENREAGVKCQNSQVRRKFFTGSFQLSIPTGSSFAGWVS
jgi:hypothetical protein